MSRLLASGNRRASLVLRGPMPRTDMSNVPNIALDHEQLPMGKPRGSLGLMRWIEAFTGIRIAQERVCPDHVSPWECFHAIHGGRPSLALVLGARGSGKSF